MQRIVENMIIAEYSELLRNKYEPDIKEVLEFLFTHFDDDEYECYDFEFTYDNADKYTITVFGTIDIDDGFIRFRNN